ncbi:UvrD-helicase domain-containing protein [Niabella insulamsoli]|uniref:UvrD-helicase domain-containing protein n=1 Tax=Niabella insulamsoli TaxID=3144874 RepID=UPI0031FDF937
MRSNIKIDERRSDILSANGHLLIEGGPGSGKTTIALLKAMRLIDEGKISRNQKILFLSFARATVSRVEEQAAHLLASDHKRKIEVNTYHGFCWSIIRSYGSHLVPHKQFRLITPPILSSLTSSLTKEERKIFIEKQFIEEGNIAFDLFSKITADIFKRSKKICTIYSKAYPIIIVDEFQDTDENEWNLIKQFGKDSTVVALADLQQRIFEFRGASITRVPEFKSHFAMTEFNLGKQNNRSSGKDIAQFGDDLLTGANKGKKYNNVTVSTYIPYQTDPKTQLRYSILASIKRLNTQLSIKDWSIAILVKTKAETLQLSTYLTSVNIRHEVIIDPAGPSLSASLIAKLMEPFDESKKLFTTIVQLLISHIRGRKEQLTTEDGKICAFLEGYLRTEKTRGSKQKQLIDEITKIAQDRQLLIFSGIPEDDWLVVRGLFQSGVSPSLKNVYEDAKYLRLLNRGAVLREKLAMAWRDNRCYLNAAKAVDEALTQEHFAMTSRKYSGIYVMNIHKSKGKEFDEVIIWEDAFRSLVYKNVNPSTNDRILLRVAVTRSRIHTTILTPKSSPCILL